MVMSARPKKHRPRCRQISDNLKNGESRFLSYRKSRLRKTSIANNK